MDNSKNAANEIQARVIARIVKEFKRGSGNSNANKKVYSDNEQKGEGTTRELEGKIITQDLVLSCLTCQEHKEWYSQKRDQDRAVKREQDVQEVKEPEDNTLKSIERIISNIFSTVEKRKGQIFWFQGKLIPEPDGAIFDDPEEANNKLVQKLRNNVKNIEYASKMSLLFYQLCRNITKMKPSEENLMKVWHILAECKNEEASLRELGMGSIFLDLVIDPAIQVIMTECSNEMKRELRSKRPRNLPAIKLPLYSESSSRSSSNSSYIASRRSSIASSSSSTSPSPRRMEPPPMPPPMPPPLPRPSRQPSEIINIPRENLERESLIQLQNLIVEEIHDNLDKEVVSHDNEDSLAPIQSSPMVPEQEQNQVPIFGMEEDPDLPLEFDFFGDDSQLLPNPL